MKRHRLCKLPRETTYLLVYADKLGLGEMIDWNFILYKYRVPLSIIRKYHKDFQTNEWHMISKYQKLSEKFIIEFQDKVSWEDISCFQILSKDFIRKFKDKIDWYFLTRYHKLSDSFREEFADKLSEEV